MKTLTTALAILLVTTAMHGQSGCKNPETDDCTVNDAIEYYRGVEGAPLLFEVVNANRATTAPDAFARRLHNSYEDFLNLLSFAIDDVEESEDGQSLIVRFNPKRSGKHLLGLTLTAAKPAISEDVKTAIPEALRDATLKSLQSTLGDTDDLTWSASYSFATARCDSTVNAEDWCWGRSPIAYRDMLSGLLVAPRFSNGKKFKLTSDLGGLFPDDSGSFFDHPLSKLKDGATRPEALRLMRNIAALEMTEARESEQLEESLHLGLLTDLIDNQPQMTGSASYRDPGELGGAVAKAASFEFHVGRENLNSIRRACRSAGSQSACILEELATRAARGLSTDKLVVTATYKETGRFQLAGLPLKDPVTGFAPVDVKSTRGINVKVQGGRQLQTEITGKPVRADLSIEGIRTENDRRRTKNRWVGTITLSVPIGDNITVPISLMYANKAEFLDENTNDRIGAHLGLSYRLPDLFGKKAKP